MFLIFYYVHPEGLEPSTPTLKVWYSAKLSYGCIWFKNINESILILYFYLLI